MELVPRSWACSWVRYKMAWDMLVGKLAGSMLAGGMMAGAGALNMKVYSWVCYCIEQLCR